MARLKAYLIWPMVVMVLLSSPILANKTKAKSNSHSAKISSITLSKPSGITRLTFEITGGAFHYQWKFLPDTQQLSLNLENTVLAAALPKSKLATTPIANYSAKPRSGKSALQLLFQLKTAADIKVYTLPATAKDETRLVVDLVPPQKVVAASLDELAASLTPPPKSSVKTPTKTAVVPATTTVTATPITQPAPEKVALTTPPVVSAEEPSPEPEVIDKPPKTTVLPSKKMPKSSNHSIMVVIDPGHGGKDSGAVGPSNTREKDVVLAISKILQVKFKQQPGFNAELTRYRDIFIPLRQRLDIARRCKADIFVAIHADAAYQNERAIGASVFALSERGATSEGARWLAQRENESEFIHGVVVDKDQVLRSVLLDLSQTHTISVSLEMGRSILNSLSTISKLHYTRVEQAAFVVLKSPDIPSLLVETGYISNPMQELKLKDPDYQQQLAEAIVKGVMQYFAQHPRLT